MVFDAGVLLGFHKPYGVLSQFSPEEGSKWGTLAGFGFPKNVYPIGRLDADSEGLLLLSDEARFTRALHDPDTGHERTYWVQVEGIPGADALRRLAEGSLVIQGHRCQPCRARRLDPAPPLPPRDPPIRVRQTVPDSWIELVLREGKNRQVRRMTAAVGHPTLRLIRVAIGSLRLGELPPGKWKELSAAELRSGQKL